MSSRLSRRQWAMLIAATPAVAQVTSKVPPQGSPAPAQPGSTPDQQYDKAVDDIRNTSRRLAAIEVPMNVEPAFSFKA
jgi:hypothetical protein